MQMSIERSEKKILEETFLELISSQRPKKHHTGHGSFKKITYGVVGTCTQFLCYLVNEDAIEDVQGAQHSCDRVCVYCLATASIRVSPFACV